ncbi:MAG: serine/threonine protein kinase, partial [Deltaproteobacteria bacterium]|nr:serine/threonine protein kinase [Deltaproteobacteria bacterium]
MTLGRGDLPAQIGRYQVIARLGCGGMAEVFLGVATGAGGFRQLVAIKRILSHHAEKREFVEMFVEEARLSAQLRHSNIAQVLDLGHDGSDPFIALEYIHGLDLRRVQRYFDRHRDKAPPALSAFVALNVCAALEHAHSRRTRDGHPLQVIHRDVSPSNVLLTFEGEVKLIDFGVAHAAHQLHETTGAMLKGKFAYMSPEQANEQPLDHRSDIFCAGTVLFKMLTGLNPFAAETITATL